MSEKFTQKKADKSTRTQPALPNARHDRSLDDRGSLETIRSCDAAGHLRCFPARENRRLTLFACRARSRSSGLIYVKTER